MKLIDLQKQYATVTNAASITLGAAVDKYRTVAQGIAAGAVAVGDTGVPFYVRDPVTGAYQAGYYTITSATVLTLERIARSSNNNQAVNFGGVQCEVYCSVPPDYLEGTSIAGVPTRSTVPSGAFALLIESDGSLSKILASAFATGTGGGGTTPVDNAPTLSAISASATGATTATGSVTTNEAGGTLYWLYSTASTATAAQVKAGSSKTVTAAGAQALAGTGLTASTSYYLHALHRDSANQDSAVLSLSASFTTGAAPATGLYQVRTTNASGQKINGVNYFPPAGSTATMAKAANGVDYFINNNDIYVSVLKADGTTMAPSPVKFVWLKSPTNCPLTFADTALPVGINGNTEAYGDAFRTVNIIYGDTYNAGSVLVRGSPGTYYLWAVTSDGFVGVYDNGTGTAIGWNLVAG